ncbi:hypothetical protein VCRA2119O147_520012 [Vibrio crassostreae]|uniref:Uncharacterized protein n=2 Tax=Vibrio TaxID=662 RepID=A0AB38NK07_9VIBR|nr:hypothetical protein FC057_23625 [Vibrio tasmaniensis]CAK1931347.1 hypothetical protein VCRA2117O39_240010 [Vibrio crassostreae]TKG37889.1 hypothetical protein FC063_22580 [Vibrio tasmaniensis]TKG39816.1 hypothetical protein FC060_24155 [Vibrio tasmaniensis]TKG41794.1 hypothetical protein FC061_23380 [Vibrio tasmaniensis]
MVAILSCLSSQSGQPSTPILSIIPNDSPLELELLLPARSAGFVQQGDTEPGLLIANATAIGLQPSMLKVSYASEISTSNTNEGPDKKSVTLSLEREFPLDDKEPITGRSHSLLLQAQLQCRHPPVVIRYNNEINNQTGRILCFHLN